MTLITDVNDDVESTMKIAESRKQKSVALKQALMGTFPCQVLVEDLS